MIDHQIKPIYDKNSKKLILGTFPSVKSREEGFFYGHPQNRFWKVLAAVYESDVLETIEEKKDFLLKNNIAVWDVIQSCDIEGSSDSSIKNVVANDLSIILDNAEIEQIFVNGKKAEQLYKKYIYPQIKRMAICLPSTSPANAAWSLERLVSEWKCIGKKRIRKLKLNEMHIVEPIFGNWEETMIWSCLQGVMGSVYVEGNESPVSAAAQLNDFCFLAGKPSVALIEYDYGKDYLIMVPQNEEWAELIKSVIGDIAVERIRYAIKKEQNCFDIQKLNVIVNSLPKQYCLNKINRKLYEQCLENMWSSDLAFGYPSYEDFERMGIGYVITENDTIVSGASSYSRYRDGIEIEIDTRKDKRRKGLASVASAALILECIKRDLYPSWDAHNKASVALAEKLGYSFSHEYRVFEIRKESSDATGSISRHSQQSSCV